MILITGCSMKKLKQLLVRSLRKYESRDCDMFEMISSFCLQIMTGYITRCLFAAFVFMLWIYFLISSLPHYGLMKIKVVKKNEPFMALACHCRDSMETCFWLVKKWKTQSTGKQRQQSWYGVCSVSSLVRFAVAFHCQSKVFLSALTAESDSQYIWNDTRGMRNAGCVIYTAWGT